MNEVISKIDGLVARPSGIWIRQKYYYLKRYLDIFSKGMKNKWGGNLTYIDVFAGPGRCLIESTNQEEDGSPLMALQYDFKKYIFVEESKELIHALKIRCKNSPKFSMIKFLEGDCNSIVDKIIPEVDSAGLNLIFIDPTGIDIYYKTIERIAKEKRVDLLINVQFGIDITRNFLFYKKRGDNSKLGLFLGDNVDWDKLNNPQDAIKLYKERIKELGYQTVEFKDIVIRNTLNAPMYFLLFASKDPRGLYFWKEIAKKDHSGQLELF
ncbi:MAG: three-Cys-motif partner protein TcmP [Candidatus Omnitrophota bacterium]